MLISPYFVHIDDYIIDFIALLNAIHSKSENEYPLFTVYINVVMDKFT